MAIRRYEASVFLNCPFDGAYRAKLRAIVFAVRDCGFQVRCALEESDSGQVRLQKIVRLQKQCRYSVHDLSRIHGRFNMPFELGLEVGLRESGHPRWRNRRCLVLDSEPYRYQRVISDLAGCDISHASSSEEAIHAVRNWLRTASRRADLPGGTEIVKRYKRFLSVLPEAAGLIRLTVPEMVFVDYALLVGTWLRKNAPPAS